MLQGFHRLSTIFRIGLSCMLAIPLSLWAQAKPPEAIDYSAVNAAAPLEIAYNRPGLENFTVSPDGRFVVGLQGDNVNLLSANGRLMRSFRWKTKPDADSTCVFWSPAGTAIDIATDTDFLTFSVTGKLLDSLPLGGEKEYSALSPDGSKVLSWGRGDREKNCPVIFSLKDKGRSQVRLLNEDFSKENGSVADGLTIRSAMYAAWLPDGKSVLVSYGSSWDFDGGLACWSAGGKLLWEIGADQAWENILGMVPNPKGDWAAVLANKSQTVKIISTKDGSTLQTIPMSSSEERIAISPFGDELVCAGGDALVFLSRAKGELASVKGGFAYASFAPDGQYVLASEGIGGGSLRTFRTSDFSEIARFRTMGIQDELLAIRGFSGGGDFVWGEHFLASIEGKPVRRFENLRAYLEGPDLFVEKFGERVTIYSGRGELVSDFSTPDLAYHGLMAIRTDGLRLVFASSKHETKGYRYEVYDNKGSLKCKIEADIDATTAAFSPDGKFLAFHENLGGALRLYDAQTGAFLASGRVKDTRTIRFSADSSWVLAIEGVTGESKLGAKLGFLAQAGATLQAIPKDKLNQPRAVPLGEGWTAFEGISWESATDRISGKEMMPNMTFGGSLEVRSPDGSTLVSLHGVLQWRPKAGGGGLAAVDDQERLWIVSTATKSVRSPVVKGARSAAIDSSGAVRLLLADGTIKRFDIKGEASAEKDSRTPMDSTHEVIWNAAGTALAFSGRYGEIGTLNARNGQAVFYGFRGSDWITFTPDGYFDCSRSGNELVSVVKGMNLWLIDQFAEWYNRPDIIIDRLGIKDEARSQWYRSLHDRRIARSKMPDTPGDLKLIPVVRKFSISQSGSSALLAFDAESADGLASWQVFANGVPVPEGKGSLSGIKASVKASIPLCSGDNLIEASVRSIRGVESVREIRYARLDRAAESRLFFVGIGISSYDDPRIPDLGYADKDALSLAERLRQAAAGSGFASGGIVETVTNSELAPARLKSIKAELASAKSDDLAILFVAGHGMHDRDPAATYYFLEAGTNLDDLPKTAVSFEELEELLVSCPARNKLLLIDTCESGELDSSIEARFATAPATGVVPRGLAVVGTGKSALPQRAAAKRPWLFERDRFITINLDRRSGATIFAAAQGNEPSLEDSRIGHGYFTQAVLDALKSGDSNGDKLLDKAELISAVTSGVLKLSEGLQHPDVNRDNPWSAPRLPTLR